MAKPQQDQSWPFRPSVNFYSQPMYNLPYQHAGICQESCCQQPSMARPYRSLPYPPLSYSQSNSFSRQATQPLSQYVPVNPYTTTRSCSTQHQRHSVVHRPIPQSRYDYEYYRSNKPRVSLKKPNTHDYLHGNNQYPSNQYPACNLYPTQEVDSSLTNIDVRQFLATWQDKDEEVGESSDHLRNTGYPINFNASYEPLDCTKRNDNLVQNCEFNKALSGPPYYNKSDPTAMDTLNPAMTYLQPYMNNSSLMSGISNNVNVEHISDTCPPQTMGPLADKDISFIPFERSIEKICNPRMFKTPSVVTSIPKSMPTNQCAMTDNMSCHNNLKDFKNNSQYHLSASLESDDLFDDINRKKEEKQKNVVHPLCPEEMQNSDNLLADPENEKTDLNQMVVKPTVDLTLENITSIPYSFENASSPRVDSKNGESQLNEKSVKRKFVQDERDNAKSVDKYNLDFHSKTPNNLLEYDEAFNIIPPIGGSVSPSKKDEMISCNVQSLANSEDLQSKVDKRSLEPISNQVTHCDMKDANSFEPSPKKSIRDELEVSSEDIELSISSGDSLMDDASLSINDLNQCLKISTSDQPNDDESVLKNNCESDDNKEKSRDCLQDIHELKTQEEMLSNPDETISENDIANSDLLNGKTQNIVAHNELSEENVATSPLIVHQELTDKETIVSNALEKIAFCYQDLNLSEDSADSTPGYLLVSDPTIKKHEESKEMLLCDKLHSHPNIKRTNSLKSSQSHSFKPTALLYWKIKNKKGRPIKPIFKNLAIFKIMMKKRKLTCKRTSKGFRKVTPQAKTLDILTECSKTNCEVNCVIYQAESHSYKRCEINSILADEVHISGKCPDSINNNCLGVETLEPLNKVEMEQNESEPSEPTKSTFPQTNFQNEIETNENESSHLLGGDSSNKKLRNVIANFFTAGKMKIDSNISCSFQEPKIVNQIIIKGAEEVGSTKWHFKNIKTISQRESIKCSLTWDKIFKSLFEQNDAFQKDSLELGPAKIHLTLSPKNGKVQEKFNNNCDMNIFKAVINARKLVLKRSGVSEERIPKMVIRKSEGHGYRSFIKDVKPTTNETDITEKPESSKNHMPLPLHKPDETTSSIDHQILSIDRGEEKEVHHCVLCQKSFTSLDEFHDHEGSASHRHLDIVQRSALHKVHNLLYGCDHPDSRPLSDLDKEFLNWKPYYPGFNHNYHYALQ